MRTVYKNTILVDAGDAIQGRTEAQKRKSEVVFRSMGVMGYDAWCIGESELSFGSEFLLEMAREAKTPLVSANLVYARTGKTLGEPYIIKKYGKIKVAVVGLLDDVLVLPRAQAEYDSLIILDAIKTAEELVPSIRKKVDVVIVLAHMGFAKSSKLAARVPEIDVIVPGHNPGVSMEARKEGSSLVMMGGTRGQYVGCLLLTVSTEEGIVSHDSKLVPLDGRIKKHKLVTAFAEEYNEQEKKLRKARQRKEQEESLSRTGDNHYLGAETCKRCHEETYQKTAATRHASAFQTLERSHGDGLNECLVCHTTGFGHSTGFGGASSSVDLEGVQCEACHGMGTKHSRDGRYSQVGERSCLVCHTSERSPDFDYKADLRKIMH